MPRALVGKAALRAATGVSLLFGIVMMGCPTPGIGDPCIPERIPCPDGGMTDAGTCPTGGFGATEVAVEVRSLQCRTRLCLIYKHQGDPRIDPAGALDDIYCSCKCGPGDRCENQCPGDRGSDGNPIWRCCTLFSGEGFPEGLQGDYCVKNPPPNERCH